jgi:hypothetical protein
MGGASVEVVGGKDVVVVTGSDVVVPGRDVEVVAAMVVVDA